MAEANQVSNSDIDARSRIARHIVYWALAAITALGLAGIFSANFISEADGKDFTRVKDIISMILPVIAAWVGTVLAFYFSRENFLAAAENNAAVLGMKFDQKLQAIDAIDAMIPIEKADTLETDKNEDSLNIKSDIVDTFAANKRNRLPVLKQDKTIRYVIHRSIVDQFIASKALASPPDNPQALTLKNLLDYEDLKSWISSFKTVDKNAKLYDVKLHMDRDPKCSDVLITEDGKPDSRVIGWITNAIVLEKLKA